MMLAAADQGLGTLWFTFFDPSKLQTLLNIPEKFEIAGLIPIGKPTEEAKAPPRKDPVVHQNRYSS
jgi:nitroreductase